MKSAVIVVRTPLWPHSSFCNSEVKMCKCFSGSRSCPETPASLKRLEGFLDAEEHKIRFESWGFLGYDSSFAFFSGKSTMVDFRVGLLKLQ